MIRTIAALSIVVASTTQAWAAPCVSSTFDVPFPGATDVLSHVTDLPSSTFPAFWQEGRLDGFAYKIFANATGVLRSADADQPWIIEVSCDVSNETCAFSQLGPPPETAPRVAERIGECLVGTTSTAETPPEPAAPIAEDVSTVVAVTSPALVVVEPVAEAPSPEPNTACGLAITSESTDVATMQRLLIMLGEDPGPVDGFLGPQTFNAMEAFVSNPGWGSSIPELVIVLSEQHCSQTQ